MATHAALCFSVSVILAFDDSSVIFVLLFKIHILYDFKVIVKLEKKIKNYTLYMTAITHKLIIKTFKLVNIKAK